MKKETREKVLEEIKTRKAVESISVRMLLTEKSTNDEIIAMIKSYTKNINNIDVIESKVMSVKRLSKRLFNVEHISDNRNRIIVRNAMFKAYADTDVKFTEHYLKERNYYKYYAIMTNKQLETFVSNMFKNEIDELIDNRINKVEFIKK